MKTDTMTTDQKRIAIAQACPEVFRVIGSQIHWRDGVEGEDTEVDPFSDLNAMAAAEATLTAEQHRAFRHHLFAGTYRGDGQNMDTAERRTVSATAAQRAEAFGLTLGLWT